MSVPLMLVLVVLMMGVVGCMGTTQTSIKSPTFGTDAKLETMTLQIEGQGHMKGMTCQGCTQAVRTALLSVPGVQTASVSLEDNQATVTFEKERTTVPQLQEVVEEAGFSAIPLESRQKQSQADNNCCGVCASSNCCGVCGG